MSEAILLYTVVAIDPIPPEIENTRGAKEPYSISLTLYLRIDPGREIILKNATRARVPRNG